MNSLILVLNWEQAFVFALIYVRFCFDIYIFSVLLILLDAKGSEHSVPYLNGVFFVFQMGSHLQREVILQREAIALNLRHRPRSRSHYQPTFLEILLISLH